MATFPFGCGRVSRRHSGKDAATTGVFHSLGAIGHVKCPTSKLARRASEHGRWLQPFADLGYQRIFVRELAGLQFRIDQVTIHGQLETSAAGRLQLETLQFLFVLGQHFGRQTDGLGLVVSRRAVSQVDLHRESPCFWNGKPTSTPAPNQPRPRLLP